MRNVKGVMPTANWPSRRFQWALAGLILMVCASPPIQAQMFVSNYNTHNLDVYNDTGLTATVPTKPTFVKHLPVGGGAEGAACLITAGVPSIFVANNSSTISVVNPVSLTVTGSVKIAGASQVAGMSLNMAGSRLYAADWVADRVWELNPSTILAMQ